MSEEVKSQILVPIDFTEESIAALQNSYNLAKFAKAEILLLFIIPPLDFFQEFLIKNDEVSRVAAEAQKTLVKMARQAKEESGIVCRTRVERGKPYSMIVKVASEIQARFIVLGKHNVDLDKKDLGSTITRVVRNSEVPVITMDHESHCQYSFNNILLPLDLTKSTSIQTFNAIAFAQYYGATIHIVTVLRGITQIRGSRIYKQMKKVAGILDENGIPYTTKIFKQTERPTFRIILDYAQEKKTDLIMLMTHQEETHSGQYIGAVATKIIHEAKTPVLTLTSMAASEQSERFSNLINTMVDPLGIMKKGK